MKYMLDTDICSYAIKENNDALAKKIIDHKSRLCISSITCAELRFGALKKDSQKLSLRANAFLSNVSVIGFNAEAAGAYAEIRRQLETQGTPIGAMDILIAASAKSEGAILVTNNGRHFSQIQGLVTEDWASAENTG